MRFIIKNTFRSLFQSPTTIILILINLILCTTTVFIFFQNYDFVKDQFDSIYYDKGTIARTYAVEFVDEEDNLAFQTDIMNKTSMYEVGKKVYQELESNPYIMFYEQSESYLDIDSFDNGDKLLPFIDEEQDYPCIHIEFVNSNNFKAWNLTVTEGRDFVDEDFSNLDINKPVSVILGNDFKKIYKIGDTIKIHNRYLGDDSAIVIGFLNEGAYYEAFGHLYYMDSYMFFPVLFPRFGKLLELYEESDCDFLNKHRRAYVDDPELDFQALVNSITTKNGFYTLGCLAFDGVQKNETEEIARRNVMLIGLLAVIGGVMCTLSLAAILYNCAYKNRTKYCIFMCSGIPIWKINLSITLEMIILLVISVFPTVGLSILEYGQLYVPVWVITLFTLPLVIVSLIPTFMANRKCNLDLLIRDKIV